MLPLEIVDHIFTFLEDDPLTLQKCLECCPELSKFVERHLYANVTIYSNTMPVWVVERLLYSPHLANYVRSLTIQIVPRLSFNRYMAMAAVLKLALQKKLPHLEKVCLASTYTGPGILWRDIQKNMRAVFLTFLRLPTLREVSIWNIIDFPLSEFDKRPNITRLLLRGDFFYSDPQVQPPYPQLDFLSLESCPPDIIPWVRSRTPRSLDFRADDPDRFQQLLQACFNTLIRLNVDLDHTNFNTEYYLPVGISPPLANASFDLSAFSKLQQLSIHASMSFATNFFVNSTGGDILEMRLCSSPLPAIVQALLTLPSSCPLQLVTLDISINNNTDFNPSEIDWSPLFLPSLFSIIRQINVRIRATNDGKSVLPSRIMSSLAVNAQLMRMVERRLLIVTAEEGG